MRNKIVTVIIFLFMPFLGFLLRMTAAETADLISKLIRIFLVYLVSAVVIASPKVISIYKEYRKYFWATLFLAIPYLIHFFFSKSQTEQFNTYAANELIVLLSMILIFTIISLMNFKFSDYYFVMWLFAAFGITLGILSIWFSLFVTPTEFLYSYVGDFLRAGTEATDPNLVSAVLNICSMASIGLYLIEKNIIGKITSILAFLISQAGRFLTFSTGGFFSILISLVALFIFLKGGSRKMMFRFFVIVLIVVSAVIISSGMGEVLFKRVTLSDELVMQSSLYSRVEQYVGFLRLIENNPLTLIYGTGSARLPEKLGLPVTLHNSYLRPLAVGGIISFVAFNFLYWICFKNFKYSLKYVINPKMRLLIAIFFAAFIGWSFQAATLPADMSGVTLFFFTFAYSLKRTVRKDYESLTIH